jgi:hypothetical protein
VSLCTVEYCYRRAVALPAVNVDTVSDNLGYSWVSAFETGQLAA